MTKFILMDIEGTTSSISFVHKTLFPFAKENMLKFIRANKEVPAIQDILTKLSAERGCGLSLPAAAELFNEWIDEDKKHSLLKKIQGHIWKEGFENGELKGHLYADVAKEMRDWNKKGLALGIYSSGSVEAQKLLFKYSIEGDLTPLLSNYFDTEVGHKREVDSYINIAKNLALDPAEILFLSDITEELDAAKKAGMAVLQLFRDEVPALKPHPNVNNFSEIEL